MMSALTGLERIPALVSEVQPGVVHVSFEGPGGPGNGSGFMIQPLGEDDSPGVVVTNAHVARCSSRLCVRLHDGSEDIARVRLCDDSTDLALLTVSIPSAAPLSLKLLSETNVGEFVIAVGSPYGLERTVTAGIISGLERTMPAPNRVPIENMIETDALINPGNSGGPLIALDGRVVGVNDQTIMAPAGGSTGLGFAIPADTVQAVYAEIVETGNDYVIRATLMARTSVRAFSYEERKRYKQKAGAMLVAEPAAGTPAAVAGLRRADVIVAFNGHMVDEPGDLYSALDRHVIGQSCELEYLRGQNRFRTAIIPTKRTSRTTA
jgi:S1-C subfamily serine protease